MAESFESFNVLLDWEKDKVKNILLTRISVMYLSGEI